MAPGQKAGSLCLSLCGNRLASLSEANSRSSRRGMAPGQKAGSSCGKPVGCSSNHVPRRGGGESDTARPSEGL